LARYDPRTDSNFFENALPKSGEPSRFALGAEGEDYASVAYLRNLGNTGWVLILSGLNMQGVEAAGEEVAHPELCLKLLQSAGFRAEGPIGPFEALLKLKAAAGSATDIRIIACRQPRP
jgi:hypothetical protein